MCLLTCWYSYIPQIQSLNSTTKYYVCHVWISLLHFFNKWKLKRPSSYSVQDLGVRTTSEELPIQHLEGWELLNRSVPLLAFKRKRHCIQQCPTNIYKNKKTKPKQVFQPFPQWLQFPTDPSASQFQSAVRAQASRRTGIPSLPRASLRRPLDVWDDFQCTDLGTIDLLGRKKISFNNIFWNLQHVSLFGICYEYQRPNRSMVPKSVWKNTMWVQHLPLLSKMFCPWKPLWEGSSSTLDSFRSYSGSRLRHSEAVPRRAPGQKYWRYWLGIVRPFILWHQHWRDVQ